MNVAKTYQGWQTMGKVYIKNNKQYIQAINPKSNTAKEIRVYTDKEYKKLYPAETPTSSKYDRPQRDVLGFEDKGYIYLLFDDDDKLLDNDKCRFHKWWGWYASSLNGIPDTANYIILNWSDVGEGDRLRPKAEVLEAVHRVNCQL